MYYGIPTIVSEIELDRLVNNIFMNDAQAHIGIVDNSGGLMCHDKIWMEDIDYFYYADPNIGVAASWNYLCHWALDDDSCFSDHIIICNDDIYFGDPRILVRAARESKDQITIESSCDYACFVMTSHIWDKVGPFDESFYPAYYEDNDHNYRCKLAGIENNKVNAWVTHDGSKSIRNSQAVKELNDIAFPLNEQLYVAKWGGKPGQETFKLPFDGGDKAMGTKELLGL